MGRSYEFECSRCGYRARVSGRADRGLDFFVQTVVCRDCNELYDAVTRLRLAEESFSGVGFHRFGTLPKVRAPKSPPTFQAAASRLPLRAARRYRWVQFSLQCPVSKVHRVQSWNDPGKCPRCATVMERNGLPFRIWD